MRKHILFRLCNQWAVCYIPCMWLTNVRINVLSTIYRINWWNEHMCTPLLCHNIRIQGIMKISLKKPFFPLMPIKIHFCASVLLLLSFATLSDGTVPGGKQITQSHISHSKNPVYILHGNLIRCRAWLIWSTVSHTETIDVSLSICVYVSVW